MAAARWLEDLELAVGEDALRSALLTAIEVGELGEHEEHRRQLRRIVRDKKRAVL